MVFGAGGGGGGEVGVEAGLGAAADLRGEAVVAEGVADVEGEDEAVGGGEGAGGGGAVDDLAGGGAGAARDGATAEVEETLPVF